MSCTCNQFGCGVEGGGGEDGRIRAGGHLQLQAPAVTPPEPCRTELPSGVNVGGGGAADLVNPR